MIGVPRGDLGQQDCRTSDMAAIDIHHHYVPEQIIGEAKRHG